MKKSMNRLSAFCLAIMCLVSISLPAFALDSNTYSTLRYVAVEENQATLNISSSGYADCYGYARLHSGYQGTTTMMLQESSNKISWSTIKSWTTSGSRTMSISDGCFVTPGSYYRVEVSTRVETSSGQYVETVSVCSPIKKY